MAAGATAADLAWEAIVSYLQEQANKPDTSSPGFAATANLACARKLMEQLPFDESFPAAAGEDRDWAERAAQQEAAPRFVPQALVLHWPGMRVRDFLRQQYRYGRGAVKYRGADTGRQLGSATFYLRLLHTGFVVGFMTGVLVLIAQACMLRGLIGGAAMTSTSELRPT
jgi:hypothetical protein